MPTSVGSRRSRVVTLSKGPVKRVPERLPWPRTASDDPAVPLGVDVCAKEQDVIKIVHKHFRVANVPMDDLLQEVFLAIVHKNFTRSAHDPRKSSFGHYVWMVANNVCINLVHRKKRYDREGNSLDAPCGPDGSRTLLDTSEAPVPDPGDERFDEYMEDVEKKMRQMGKWDLARYVRAARSGASPDVIRDVLSWGDRKVSAKTVRDMRNQIRTWMESGLS